MNTVNIAAAVLAGVLIGLAQTIETIGYHFRRIGSEAGSASLGYSIHVQTATASRLGSLLAFPIVGLLLDLQASVITILFVPLTACTVFIIGNIAFGKMKASEKILIQLFQFVVRRISRLETPTAPAPANSRVPTPVPPKRKRELMIAGCFAYCAVTSGTYAAFILAAVLSDYRATALQLAPALTAIGTLVSVTYFDPRVSVLIDGNFDKREAVEAIAQARTIAASIVLAFVFVVGIIFVSVFRIPLLPAA